MAVTAKYSEKIQVNVTKEISEEVKRLSDVQGVSYAEIVRQALEAGLPVVRNIATGSPSIR